MAVGNTGVLACVLSIVFALALSGCAATIRDWQEADTERAWKMAQEKDTVQSYEQFLRSRPESQFHPEAREKLKYAKIRREAVIAVMCENFSQLKHGMTPVEVKDTLGFSFSIYAIGPSTVPHQVFSGTFYRLEFSYGELVKWSHTLQCDK